MANVFAVIRMIILADLHGAVLVDRDRIAHLDRLEEFIAEHIDRHDAQVLPDVRHEHAGGGQRVDRLREQQGLGTDADRLHPHQAHAAHGRPDRRRGTEDRAREVLAIQLLVAGVSTGRRVGSPCEHVLHVRAARVERLPGHRRGAGQTSPDRNAVSP